MFHLSIDYFLTHKVAEKDAAALEAIHEAEASQRKFYRLYGRYYSVGPVRGPYRDEHGLNVKKDVILQVVPVYDKEARKEASGDGQPIEGYDDMNVEEVKDELDDLSEGDLKKVKSYEEDHKNRKTILEQLDSKIGDGS